MPIQIIEKPELEKHKIIDFRGVAHNLNNHIIESVQTYHVYMKYKEDEGFRGLLERMNKKPRLLIKLTDGTEIRAKEIFRVN